MKQQESARSKSKQILTCDQSTSDAKEKYGCADRQLEMHIGLPTSSSISMLSLCTRVQVGWRRGAAQRRSNIVGILDAENFKLSVLKGTDPPENTAFDLRPWRRLPKFIDSTGITEAIGQQFFKTGVLLLLLLTEMLEGIKRNFVYKAVDGSRHIQIFTNEQCSTNSRRTKIKGLLRCLQVAVLLLNLMGSSCAMALSLRKKKITRRKIQENTITTTTFRVHVLKIGSDILKDPVEGSASRSSCNNGQKVKLQNGIGPFGRSVVSQIVQAEEPYRL
ncbi:uncharacterized protein LOC135298679 [Passer domesticus]|uniref:uncharacterized protein LOC135298679 n=1 Tax=Passer domesticus TaxID=48849 RepID=UPI0030FF0671